MHSLRTFMRCILIFVSICLLQQVYCQNPRPKSKVSKVPSTMSIYSDKELKNPVNEATLDDTVYLNLRPLKLKKPLSYSLYVNDTLIKGPVSTDATVIVIPLSAVSEYIRKPEMPFKMISFGLGKDKPVFRTGFFKLVFEPYSLASCEPWQNPPSRPDDQVWIRSGLSADLTNHLVFINNYPVPAGKLLRELSIPDKNVYYFVLRNKISNNDSLAGLFNRDNHEFVIVKLSIGKSFEMRKELRTPLVIVFDENKITREYFSIAGSILILLILIAIFRNNKGNKLGFLRDSESASKTPPYSLAKSQMAFWTLIILIAYFYIWYQTGTILHITPQVLILLGISAVTRISGAIIDQGDIANPQIITRHQDKNNSKTFLMNILSDQEGVSIHRFQNVAFTIAIGGYFLFEVFINCTIPALDTNLIVLMGISSATYIAVKQGENKSLQEKIVG